MSTEVNIMKLKDTLRHTNTMSESTQPQLISMLPGLLKLLQGKGQDRDTILEIQQSINNICNGASPHVIGALVLPPLLVCLQPSSTVQSRMLILDIISNYAKNERYAPFIAKQLQVIIPFLSTVVNDARKEIASRGEETLDACVHTCTNKDIAPFLKVVVDCLAHPEKIGESIHSLSATTFVQAVETPTIAIILPILSRGLNERQIATVRRTTVICENMCKLVENPTHAIPLIEKILPLLERTKAKSSDPECRSVATRTYDTLFKASQELLTLPKAVDINMHLSSNVDNAEVRQYIIAASQSLLDNNCFEKDTWIQLFSPLCNSLLIDDLYSALVDKNRVEVKVEEESGEDLCNCEFSLAYGGKILLNQARLHLRRGQRYGLCGANGTGKSTLLRAIANGQLDGFPSKDEVRTAVVEHDLDGSLSDMSCFDYIMNGTQCDREEVIHVMEDVGCDKRSRAL